MDQERTVRLGREVLGSVPYWSQPCQLCGGYIADPLLECAVPKGHALNTLLSMKPGTGLLCPYCHQAIGFDDQGQLDAAPEDWPVVKYSRAALEDKKQLDGAPVSMSLEEWARKYRFDRPGSKEPLENYPYAP
jgi:hypothetical protein